MEKMTTRGIIKDSHHIRGLGAYSLQNQKLLFFSSGKSIYCSRNIHLDFGRGKDEVKLLDSLGKAVSAEAISSFRISAQGGVYFLTYLRKNRHKSDLYLAKSADLITFKTIGKVSPDGTAAVMVADYRFRGHFLLYAGGDGLRIIFSNNLIDWKTYSRILLPVNFSRTTFETVLTEKVKEGVLLYFFQKIIQFDGRPFYSLQAAIFNPDNPSKLVWHSENSLWEEPGEWQDMGVAPVPFGAILVGEELISFWQAGQKEILAVTHKQKHRAVSRKKSFPTILLDKFRDNPILKPVSGHFWESKAVFNPAALYDRNRIHLIYRAVGNDDMSVLGYASSADGINFDRRSEEPIYRPPRHPGGKRKLKYKSVPLSAYSSGGGGYGGCEDPRLTRIGRKIYMTYVAYDGFGPPRVALTSIATSDFRDRNWQWQDPVIISPPNVVDKNCTIFPEKINGKYVIMHRIFPHILIDFVDSLDFDGSSFLKGEYRISPRPTSWDSRKVGAGAPPIKTEYGWLLIYHAVDDRDPGRYKMGAMLLDLNDPTKVLARTHEPILEPEEPYENEGLKYGVAYPCGAVVFNDNLHVYYGGADMVICMATASVKPFLNDLLEHQTGILHPISFN